MQRFGNETVRLLNLINDRLGESAYLAGDDYTLADVAHYHWLSGLLAKFPQYFPEAAEGLKLTSEAFPNIAAWVAKIAERPAVKQADAVFEGEAFKSK